MFKYKSCEHGVERIMCRQPGCMNRTLRTPRSKCDNVAVVAPLRTLFANDAGEHLVREWTNDDAPLTFEMPNKINVERVKGFVSQFLFVMENGEWHGLSYGILAPVRDAGKPVMYDDNLVLNDGVWGIYDTVGVNLYLLEKYNDAQYGIVCDRLFRGRVRAMLLKTVEERKVQGFVFEKFWVESEHGGHVGSAFATMHDPDKDVPDRGLDSERSMWDTLITDQFERGHVWEGRTWWARVAYTLARIYGDNPHAFELEAHYDPFEGFELVNTVVHKFFRERPKLVLPFLKAYARDWPEPLDDPQDVALRTLADYSIV